MSPLEEVRGIFTADAELVEGDVKLTIWHSTDRAPVRRFEPVQVIRLNFVHALELLGSLTLALREQTGIHRDVGI